MNYFVINIYHNKNLSIDDIESLFIPIFGHVYSYLFLLNISNHTWCAYIDNTLIGCVLTKNSLGSSRLYLILFGIKPIYQTMGIGSHLLSLVIDYGKKHAYRNIYLHTECTNKCAIKFYKRFHFHIDLFIENYYGTMLTFYPHAFQMNLKL